VETIRVTSRIFEIELDGFYRAIAVFNEAGKPHVWSRYGLPLAEVPSYFKGGVSAETARTILDGEVVAVNENGIPRSKAVGSENRLPQRPLPGLRMSRVWVGEAVEKIPEVQRSEP
jgi:hypothetical protein